MKEFQIEGITFEVSPIKDTKELQLDSLQSFADVLGYSYCWFRGAFFNYKDFTTDKETVSFRSMVDLHNKGNIDNHGQPFPKWGWDVYMWNKAKAASICTVHLQLNKKTKYVSCQKHLVKFIHKEYEHLFLGSN